MARIIPSGHMGGQGASCSVGARLLEGGSSNAASGSGPAPPTAVAWLPQSVLTFLAEVVAIDADSHAADAAAAGEVGDASTSGAGASSSSSSSSSPPSSSAAAKSNASASSAPAQLALITRITVTVDGAPVLQFDAPGAAPGLVMSRRLGW